MIIRQELFISMDQPQEFILQRRFNLKEQVYEYFVIHTTVRETNEIKCRDLYAAHLLYNDLTETFKFPGHMMIGQYQRETVS